MFQNNLLISILRHLVCFLMCAPVVAQEAIQQPSPASPIGKEPAGVQTTFVQDPEGVSLRLEQKVSSEFANRGDQVRFTLVNDLSDGRKVLAPAGSTFYARVAQVKATDHRHPAKLELSDATLDLGNGQQLRLKRTDGQDDLFTLGAIPVLIVGAVTLVPMTLAMLPIQLPYLAIHDIHERRQRAKVGTSKPWLIDIEIPQGTVLTYYANHTLTKGPPNT
jgi:hypothetical protein